DAELQTRRFAREPGDVCRNLRCSSPCAGVPHPGRHRARRARGRRAQAENHRIPRSTERRAARSRYRPHPLRGLDPGAAARKAVLDAFPSYLEPYVETTVDGVPKRFKEKLHMYVAEARFALARPPGSIDLASFVSLPFVERIDAAIKHSLIAPADAV